MVLQLHPEEEQQFTDLLRREEEQTVVEDLQCERSQRPTCHRQRAEFRFGDSQKYLLVHLSPIGPDGRRLNRHQIRGFQANQVHIYGIGFWTVAATELQGNTPESGHYVCQVRSTGGGHCSMTRNIGDRRTRFLLQISGTFVSCSWRKFDRSPVAVCSIVILSDIVAGYVIATVYDMVNFFLKLPSYHHIETINILLLCI